jgi:hypothetical protein
MYYNKKKGNKNKVSAFKHLNKKYYKKHWIFPQVFREESVGFRPGRSKQEVFKIIQS